MSESDNSPELPDLDLDQQANTPVDNDFDLDIGNSSTTELPEQMAEPEEPPIQIPQEDVSGTSKANRKNAFIIGGVLVASVMCVGGFFAYKDSIDPYSYDEPIEAPVELTAGNSPTLDISDQQVQENSDPNEANDVVSNQAQHTEVLDTELNPSRQEIQQVDGFESLGVNDDLFDSESSETQDALDLKTLLEGYVSKDEFSSMTQELLMVVTNRLNDMQQVTPEQFEVMMTMLENQSSLVKVLTDKVDEVQKLPRGSVQSEAINEEILIIAEGIKSQVADIEGEVKKIEPRLSRLEKNSGWYHNRISRGDDRIKNLEKIAGIVSEPAVKEVREKLKAAAGKKNPAAKSKPGTDVIKTQKKKEVTTKFQNPSVQTKPLVVKNEDQWSILSVTGNDTAVVQREDGLRQFVVVGKQIEKGIHVVSIDSKHNEITLSNGQIINKTSN